MAKLLNEGRTDLLPGFISQRTRRPFKAYLAKGKDGKVSFEFEPRPDKPPAKGKAKAAPADAAPEASAAKKVAVKKTAVKKTAVKKTASKKSAVKKTAVKKAA